MVVRFYSSTAAETTLSGTINAGATTVNVGSVTGFPVSFPYTVAIDYEGAAEELVDVTAAAGTSLTVTRGVDGTGATSHTAGARVRHVSSGRDFRDSRDHENNVAGVHGVTGNVVGTTDTQTLSNKTLTNATGTLNRIDILSEGGTPWETTVNGDIDHNTNLMSWKRGPSEPHAVTVVANNGNVLIRNQNAGADTVTNTYRLRVTKDNGTTDIVSVLSGGTVTSFTDSGQTGFQVKPRTADNNTAFRVRNVADTADTMAVWNNGRVDINGTDPAFVQLDVKAAAGQAADITRWLSSADVLLAYVNSTGEFDSVALVATTGVFTASAGWSILDQTAVKKAGVVTVYANISRTGADIPANASGNITDTDVATIAAGWRPNAAFAGDLMPTCITDGFGDGGARLEADTGLITLVSWSSDGSIITGRNYRFSMTYVR